MPLLVQLNSMKKTSPAPDRLIVAITGASGAIYGIRALELLKDLAIQTHLVISPSAEKTIASETDYNLEQVISLAAICYDSHDLAAPISSGSFVTRGMLVVPCSIKTLSAVANSYANNLIARAADVCLKEGRPLLLAVRETPLHLGHIRLLKQAASSGAIIFPPVPAFYARPASLDDVITQTVGRMLLRLGIPNPYFHEWNSE
jgi:4-hydroxy-3-polyprenylbenzoate decarboxylase